MANSKITDLTSATAASGDEIPINRGGLDRKITLPLPVAAGGTGATTAAGAISALGIRRKLTADETFYVRTAPSLVTVSIGSPATVSWSSHGLSIGDRVCFHTNAKFQACTITEANPGVVSASSHGFSIGDAIEFHTTGTLPTNMSPQNTVYVIATDFGANSFKISNTAGGAAIDTSGAVQAGSHFVRRARHVKVGTCTISLAAQAVVSCTGHGLVADTPIVFSTTGVLPGTIASGEQYIFTVSSTDLTADTFKPLYLGAFNDTSANSQSGTHTLWRLTGLPTGLVDGYPYYIISSGFTSNSFQISLTSGGAAVNTTGTNPGVPIYAHTGNNSNDGSAATRAGAFLTPSGAVDYIYQNIDVNGYTVTIQLAQGVYGTWDNYSQDCGFTIPYDWTGGGNFIVQGDSTATHETVLAIEDHRADLIALGAISLGGQLNINYLTLSNPTFACIRLDGSGATVGIASCNYLDVPTGDQTLILQSRNIIALTGTHYIYANKSADFIGLAHLYSYGNNTLVTHAGNLFQLNGQQYSTSFVWADHGGRILVAANQAGTVTAFKARVDGRDSRVWEQQIGTSDAILGSSGVSFGSFGWFVHDEAGSANDYEIATVGPFASAYSRLPTTTEQGALAAITDSSHGILGAIVAATTLASAKKVLSYYDGTNWVVAAAANYATSASGLPTASTLNIGARAFVTDATTNTFLAAVVGGSTYAVPVVSNGAGWVIG